MFFMSLCGLVGAQKDVEGVWRTIDDRTGKPKAVVRIYKEDGSLHGVVVRILEEGRENAVCAGCKGHRKGAPIVGMKVIEGLRPNDNGEWSGNTLYDPENDMSFRCKIWLDPDNEDELKVRGYLAVIQRTQTWLREK